MILRATTYAIMKLEEQDRALENWIINLTQKIFFILKMLIFICQLLYNNLDYDCMIVNNRYDLIKPGIIFTKVFNIIMSDLLIVWFIKKGNLKSFFYKSEIW